MTDMPESLRKKRDEWCLSNEELEPCGHYNNQDFCRSCHSFNTCYAEMKEREKRLVEALEFYACSKNYNSTAPYGAGITHPTLIFEDDGYKARKALEGLKK